VTTYFAIFRHDSSGYSTRGPTAAELTLDQARREIARLKSTYPHQDFVIMGEVGTVTRSERVTVRIAAPDIPGHARKRPKPPFEPKVIPILREGVG
jgi:hypothetical protein